MSVIIFVLINMSEQEASEYEYVTQRRPYNRRRAEYVDNLPEDVIPVDDYNGYQFNKYWFDVQKKRLIMRTCNNRYKIMKPTHANGTYLVVLFDVDKKPHSTSYKKLYRLMTQNIMPKRN